MYFTRRRWRRCFLSGPGSCEHGGAGKKITMNTVYDLRSFSKKFDAEQKFEQFKAEPSATGKLYALMKRLGQNFLPTGGSLMFKGIRNL